MKNFSLIGTGFIMPRHAEAIGFVEGKIIDVINTAYGPDSWRKVITNTLVDYIVVLTPNDLHYEISMAASQAGKIVLCEKPIAINLINAQKMAQQPNIFTCLQIRHHDFAKQLKSQIRPNDNYEIEMDINVHRDNHYYQSWKGQSQRSGGVLYNLGVHYFDLLLYLFGEPTEVKTEFNNEKTSAGIINGANYSCKWRVSTEARREDQYRKFKINGIDYNFSSKDNLSHENLHRFVYRDLIEGKGVSAAEGLRSIDLIDKLSRNI